jgi:hypothetical protein
MARINVEDEWFTDARRLRLIELTKDKNIADGMAIMAWFLAQKYWVKKELIPYHAWHGAGMSDLLFECGLAEKREDGVYVRGSKRHFHWYFKKVEAGRKGGLKSSQRQRDSKGRLTTSQAVLGDSSKQTPSTSNPLTPTLTLTHKEKNTLYDSGESHREEFNLNLIYQEYPRRRGQANKGKGLERLKKMIKNQSDYELALAAVRGYKAHLISQGKINTEFVKMFSSFWDAQGDWKEWAAAPVDQAMITDELIKKAKGEL